MRITVPTTAAKGPSGPGRYGMQVAIVKAFSKNFHAQFSLPHFMPRMLHSAYKLTFWARVDATTTVSPEVAFVAAALSREALSCAASPRAVTLVARRPLPRSSLSCAARPRAVTLAAVRVTWRCVRARVV